MTVLRYRLGDGALDLPEREIAISGVLVHDLHETVLIGLCGIGHPCTRLAHRDLDLGRFLSWLVIGLDTLLTRQGRNERFIRVNLGLQCGLHALVQARFQTVSNGADILRGDGLVVACERSTRKGTIHGGHVQAATGAVDVPSCNIACWSCHDGVRGDGGLSEGRIAGGGNDGVLLGDDLDAICTDDDGSGWYHLAVGGGIVEREKTVGGSGILVGLACCGNGLLLAHRHSGERSACELLGGGGLSCHNGQRAGSRDLLADRDNRDGRFWRGHEWQQKDNAEYTSY